MAGAEPRRATVLAAKRCRGDAPVPRAGALLAGSACHEWQVGDGQLCPSHRISGKVIAQSYSAARKLQPGVDANRGVVRTVINAGRANAGQPSTEITDDCPLIDFFFAPLALVIR